MDTPKAMFGVTSDPIGIVTKRKKFEICVRLLMSIMFLVVKLLFLKGSIQS